MEMQSKRRNPVNWCDLPTEIVQSIGKLFYKPEDARNFRSVCRKWRRSTHISAFLPRSVPSMPVLTSSIFLVRPIDAPHFPPWMVLAVETSKGVTQLFNPFSRTPLSHLPQNLDLAQFQSTLVASEYHVVYEFDSDDLFPSGSSLFLKVLAFFKQSLPCIRNCILLAVYNGGTVCSSKPFGVSMGFSKAFHDRHNVDDIVMYKGIPYALDVHTHLFSYAKREEHCYCDRGFHLCKPVVGTYYGKYWDRHRRRNRLVTMASSSGEILYMVKPLNGRVAGLKGANKLYFKVCQLYRRTDNSWGWASVTSFEDADQVLFVTREHCFFVSAAEFPQCQLKNCIVFTDDAFPRYSTSEDLWKYGKKGGKEIAIYSLGGKSRYSLPVECYPGFPVMLSSPPPWVSPDVSSPSQSQSKSESEEDEMIQSESNNEDTTSSQEEVSSAPSEPECEEQTAEVLSANAAQAQTTASPPVMNYTEHVVEEVLETEKLGDTTIQTHSMDHLVQSSVKKVVIVKFQGLDVESDHLPVLQKVWMKHGDIVEGSLIRSSDTKTMALTSLAKMVLILQTNSGKTLTNDQAHYLDSTLSDLQCMRLKVDWLAPFVEKALAMHKTKPLQASLVKLQKAKSNAEEMEQKFLSEMAEMKRELDKDIKVVSEILPMNLDKCLGEGLC